MTGDPPVCLCVTAVAVQCGGFGPHSGWCQSCGKPIVSLHPGLISAIRHWPQLDHQTVVRRTEQVA